MAVANQKGGVGKTTSVINLAAEFAQKGYKTLVVDLDPQGNASSGLGVGLREGSKDLFDLFLEQTSLQSIIVQANNVSDKLYVAPSSRDLIGVEVELGKKPGRELILRSQIKLLLNSFDCIFIDCPPSCGLLTLNALGAAHYVLIPVQAEYYALEGITLLLDTVQFVKETFNPSLDLIGVFVTMYDSRTCLSADVAKEIKKFFKDLAFRTVIPRNIRISESPSHSLPISLYAPSSKGALAYKALAKELEKRLFGLISKGYIKEAS
ncbi:MAG: ParA family protein [Candidatus Dadabacteria bacterium]|nr:MAG: ParA family protein [Candidatus Dadabacteria bacterium]